MKDKKYLTFSNNLKYLMAINNKSRNDICKDLKFNYTTVREWCNGTSFPRYEKIEKLASYFNVTKAELLEEEKNSLLTSTARNSFLLTDYINNLARNDIQRETLNNVELLNDKHLEIINQQALYYIDKENEENRKEYDDIMKDIRKEK